MPVDTEVIREFTGKYRFLSNFFSCFIFCEGLWFPSVENAYQAMKMKNPVDRLRFSNLKASEAKKLGRVCPMKDGWDDEKLQVMYLLVKQKFMRYIELRDRLLETGELEIQEGNYWGDVYWGTVNGFGENHLGQILMRIRSELKADYNLDSHAL